MLADLGLRQWVVSPLFGFNKGGLADPIGDTGKLVDDLLYLEKMAEKKGVELIAGVAASPGLGSLVMFGLGGIFVEVLKDVAVAVAPLSRPEADELVRAIQGFEVLTGLRGQDPVDLPALTEMMVRVSLLAADFPEIVEMDLNPIFAYPSGKAPVAVDVRLKVE